MDARDCAIMSEAYGMDPWLVDASGVSLARRPRLYWFNWEPRSSSGVSVSSSTSSRLPLKGEVELRGQVDPCDFLEPGWKRVESLGKFPTFTTARPSLTPGRKPAGLALCCEETVTRWRDDLHRFPPYQYRRENKLCHELPGSAACSKCVGEGGDPRFPFRLYSEVLAKGSLWDPAAE